MTVFIGSLSIIHNKQLLIYLSVIAFFTQQVQDNELLGLQTVGIN